MNCYLWGYYKSEVYDISPASIDVLKENIQREMANISESNSCGSHQ